MEVYNNDFKNQEEYQRAKRKVKELKGFYSHLAAYIIINIFLLAIKFVNKNNDFDNFWEWDTFKVLFYWGFGLTFHAYNVFGKNMLFGKEWENRKIDEYMNKNKN